MLGSDAIGLAGNLFSDPQGLIATISIVSGVITYFINSRREIELKQAQRYSEMDTAFTDFQKTLLNYTHLDAGWQSLQKAPNLSEDEQYKRSVIFEIATSMFEKAYLLYLKAPKKIRRQQWSGWRAYIRGYCAKPEYRKWFFGEHSATDSNKPSEAASYDTAFEKFMLGLFKEVSV